ncbi:MAG: Nif3-like dinuclear metal center hexameric protein [Hydrogenophaga sp.]|jgi:dinuclear metal center YbgI/SA1388 family protein|uniref:Nif3-like dinuclear metal center hexameric protein n=1 Tax=Hydrogenophaga sp. TaxID=1904254 RepID=UPI0027286009|nr:Nif3-like dinuclear metal center hexameric protein [Hydrogenophaga sp.]MDO9200535.1 Nif3-like dinuclear metal center hexameric protein [Hydrogenophaga sp.]MDO9483603.1 Nif3-like dinuclear metal center hexameric protein [Hydrogenophaga sp.]MDO9571562.1 Nif3-like dinuclear metal center hexameric protein [Hydrogenophaga sp.]MDP2095036.1 Nif3-like dinuclear metal center hexameric protein [Hydrogenophaga sp.]MDP3343401.1 Nif3-like dinuclear metal center hexameric protein [Hydrogenophaga sp.]
MKTTSSPISRTILLQTLDGLLQPSLFNDHGPNGLQVEGREEVHKLVTGVTACRALIDAAIAAGADAILVHHGLFWRGQDGCVTGWMKQRLARLLAHDINLLAYHLPLDAHPVLGNNAQLALRLGVSVFEGVDGRFGPQCLGFMGHRNVVSAAALAAHVEQSLGRAVTLVGEPDRPVERVALCTGGAQSYFEAAIAAGADVFITGEISEPQAHYARECGVAYIACGHHASERYGVQAVGAYVAQVLGLEHQFIDIDNPA